jgi:hypothetical protein
MARLTRRFRIVRRRFGRRLGSGGLLVVFALTATGVPLPTGKNPQKSGELFPCATCKCGCATAEQCWRSCCCHTLAERLAWAREHGVEPPAFALAEARSIGLLADKLAAKTCCPKKVAADTPGCCQKNQLAAAPAERSCCQKHTAQLAAARPAEKTDSGIVAWRALACRGQSLQWLAAVPTLIVVRHAWSHRLPCVAWLGPAASEHGEGIAYDPAVPPPEWA